VLAAIVVAGATIFNIVSVLRYSRANTGLVAQSAQDEQRAAELRASAAELRRTVDPRQIQVASADARQANDLIDRRTFSWTELFNRFEATLPDAVRITQVRPTLDRERRIVLRVTVIGRTVDDINQFMERLDATNAFSDLRSVEERVKDDDQIESALEMTYQPQAAEPVSAAPVSATQGAR
jgi:hypothetical protein